MQSLQDIRMKKNVTEEGRAILGTKISEINIKERSLLKQLKDVKTFLCAQIETRHKELSTEVSKRVREKRKVLEGRKANLDRVYSQTEYGMAFVENAINGNAEDEKVLLTKRMIQRQLKKLKRSNKPMDLPANETDFRLDLYFQHFTGQNLHSNLDNVLKMVMSDLTVSSVPIEPPKPKPKPTPPPPSPSRPQATTPQKQMMGGPGVPRSSPARMTITPVSRQMTPQKQLISRQGQGQQSPIRQASPARQMGGGPRMGMMTSPRPTAPSPGRGRGRPPMQQQIMRGQSPGRGGGMMGGRGGQVM